MKSIYFSLVVILLAAWLVWGAPPLAARYFPQARSTSMRFDGLSGSRSIHMVQTGAGTVRETRDGGIARYDGMRQTLTAGLRAVLTITMTTLGLVLLVLGGRRIMARFATRRKAIERRFNPYVAGTPIRDADMFYGRRALLSKVETALYRNSLILHGPRRIGKTSLLYQLRHRLRHKVDGYHHFIPVLIDLEGSPESEFFHRLMEGVLEAVIEMLPADFAAGLAYTTVSQADDYTDRHFRRDMQQILTALPAHERQPRLILLIDEADILNSYRAHTQQQFRRILQDANARSVGVVLAGVEIDKAWDREESPWYNMFIEMPVPPLSRSEAEQLIRQPVAGFYRWNDAAMHRIWRISRGYPHRIQQICLEAVNIMLDQRRRHITLADVESACERIQRAEQAL